MNFSQYEINMLQGAVQAKGVAASHAHNANVLHVYFIL